MAKLGIVYFLIFISSLEACNPNAQNVTTLETPNHTDRPRPIATTTLPPSVETSTAAVTEKVTVPFVEEYSANCHSDEAHDENNNSTSNAYQHIIVSGLPFQRGESHGRQARDKILKLISFYKSSKLMPAWNDCINFVRSHYLEALNNYYPNGLEEMKRIAQGAGVQLEDILILNSRYELIRWNKSENSKNYAGFNEKKARSSSELPECIIRQISLDSIVSSTSADDSTTRSNENNNSIGDEDADECTGAVALSGSTKYAHVLLGQNWDTNEFILKEDTAILLEVHPDPCENIKPFVMLTEAGQLGNMGMNSEGLGVVGMSLSSSSDTFQRSTGRGWVPVSLLRRMFLESPSFSMGLRAILRTPIHVSVNMIIATADDEALNLELTPNNYFSTQAPLEKEFLAHSNHFKSTSFTARNDIREGSQGGTSLFRDRRVERHLMNDWPRISEETFQTAFRDHVGYPNAVCEHSVPKDMGWTSITQGKMTVASIILNLSQGTLQLTKGPPCTEAYRTYCFKFSRL